MASQAFKLQIERVSPIPDVHRNEQLEHDNRQQAIIIAELQAALTSTSARLAAVQQHNTALHRYGVAHGAAYGRLAAHTAGLHQQFARQLSGLRQLCRHLGLQLAAALAAADPLAGTAVLDCGSSGVNETVGTAPAATATTASVPGSAASVAAAVLALESLRTELQVAVQLMDMQAGSGEVRQLASVPASIADALATDLAELPAELLSSPRLEPSGSAVHCPLTTKQPLPMPANAPAMAAAGPGGGPGLCLGLLPAGSQSGPGLAMPEGAACCEGPGAAPLLSALSAQVSQMEAHLQSLAGSRAEQAAAAAAARQLHGQEQAARQRAQERAVQLSSQLEAVQVGTTAVCVCVCVGGKVGGGVGGGG